MSLKLGILIKYLRYGKILKKKGVGYRYFEYDDPLLFFVLPNEQWNKLEKEQGKTKLNKYFPKITLNSKMFSLQHDVVEYLRLKKNTP